MASASVTIATATSAINCAKLMSAAPAGQASGAGQFTLSIQIQSLAQAVTSTLFSMGYVGPTLRRNTLFDITHLSLNSQLLALRELQQVLHTVEYQQVVNTQIKPQLIYLRSSTEIPSVVNV
jgi:hypothetical protein